MFPPQNHKLYKKNNHSINNLYRRYKILCIHLVKDVPKPEKASAIILQDHLKMPEENYRLGKTKVLKRIKIRTKIFAFTK